MNRSLEPIGGDANGEDTFGRAAAASEEVGHVVDAVGLTKMNLANCVLASVLGRFIPGLLNSEVSCMEALAILVHNDGTIMLD